jgi:hypothetical protein
MYLSVVVEDNSAAPPHFSHLSGFVWESRGHAWQIHTPSRRLQHVHERQGRSTIFVATEHRGAIQT